jgi:hypothetical protein
MKKSSTITDGNCKYIVQKILYTHQKGKGAESRIWRRTALSQMEIVNT